MVFQLNYRLIEIRESPRYNNSYEQIEAFVDYFFKGKIHLHRGASGGMRKTRNDLPIELVHYYGSYQFLYREVPIDEFIQAVFMEEYQKLKFNDDEGIKRLYLANVRIWKEFFKNYHSENFIEHFDFEDKSIANITKLLSKVVGNKRIFQKYVDLQNKMKYREALDGMRNIENLSEGVYA